MKRLYEHTHDFIRFFAVEVDDKGSKEVALQLRQLALDLFCLLYKTRSAFGASKHDNTEV